MVANVQPGDIVVDAMAGAGTIPIEAVSSASATRYALAGDIERGSVSDIIDNVKFASATFRASGQDAAHLYSGGRDLLAAESEKGSSSSVSKGTPFSIDCCRWDCRSLPLRSNFVDVLCVDMPFGKRCKLSKRELVPILKEFARVLRPDCGRAVLLSTWTFLGEYINSLGEGVALTKSVSVNVGGLQAGLFVMVKKGSVS